MITLSTAIMAVPDRSEWVGGILNKIDPDGGEYVQTTWDLLHDGPVPTFLRTLATALDRDCSHVLILQDDVLPCLDFLAGVRAAIEARDRWPLNFWTADRSKEVQILNRNHQTFANVPWWNGNLAVALPADHARMLLAWMPDGLERVVEMARADYPERDSWSRFATCDDMVLRYFLKEHGIQMLHTLPSLVQHRAVKETTAGSSTDDSLVRLRWSPYFIGEDVSALTVRWR